MTGQWLVDGANVVGTRPDGWWRDRPAAARRLYDALLRLTAASPELSVMLVLEGAARPGVPAASSGPVVVVHADGSGDDTLVGLAGPDVTVVTADRGLIERVRACGASVAGPGELWRLLDRVREG